jgi:hypothetical protein
MTHNDADKNFRAWDSSDSSPPVRQAFMSNVNGMKYIKGKAIPLQAYGAQRVLGSLRLPDSVTSALEGGRLSAIRTGHLYPQEYPGAHFKSLSRPRAYGIVGCHGKNPQ